mmetsp:Transcript_112830/g.319079  ORF Transcript_112830/g.319079 Transcript_112830/m.319079 type:complete len:339 (+) Transcript_112830:85-1101(+)
MCQIDRLADLRKAAGIQGIKQAIVERLVDTSEASPLRGIIKAEAAARSSYGKVCERVEQLRGHMDQLQKMMLPRSISRLTGQIIDEENNCLKLIKRTKQMLYDLMGGETDRAEDTATLKRIRDNLAEHLSTQLKDASRDFVSGWDKRRQEQLGQARRLLMFAYPDASDDELQSAVQCLEIAALVVERRVSDYTACAALGDVIAQLETNGVGMQLRLEADAQCLELLFFQFHELVQEGDAPLTEIEENIEAALKETQEAVKYLKEARRIKAGNEYRRWMFLGLFALMFSMILWSMSPAFPSNESIWGGDQSDAGTNASALRVGRNRTKVDPANKFLEPT